MNEIQARLKTLLANNFGVDEQDIDPDATFEALGVDSIALVELAVVAEEEFGVKVGEDEFTPENTITTAAQLLASKGVAVT
jgi:acyl carrier protein